MKIKTDRYGTVRNYNTIEDYAECVLDGGDYGKGAMEAAADTARNNSKAIGRMLDLFASKGLISAEDVGSVIDGYVSGLIGLEN